MRILIVDDTRTLRQMLRSTLGGAGHEVIEAEDGAKGLASFRREQPDLVITDLNMPVMDGVELTAAIRALPQGGTVPVFVLTTEAGAEWKAKGRAAGATGWMVKPFEATRLLAMLARYERQQ
jgi:two-component system chemotaxis response regulator CheY